MRVLYNRTRLQMKKIVLLLILSIASICIVITIARNSPINDVDRKNHLKKIDALIRSQTSSYACKQPQLPVYSPEMMKFVHEVPPIDCSAAETDWVKCNGSECQIQDKILARYGSVQCGFTDRLRIDDFMSTDGHTTYSDSYYKLEASDVVKVSCTSPSGNKWAATITGTRFDPNIWSRADWSNIPRSAAKLNVLMLGFDSLSRNTFMRKLPKSYNYLVQTLQGNVLKGYNIVGDGTPQALIPLLTGKTELELPDTRKRLKNTKFVNTYPFIWNDYQRAGYVTGFLEDVPELSTFTYRLNGFNETPTDHYMRPYYLDSLRERGQWPKLCTGDVPRHKIMFNQIRDFFALYRKKPSFLFAFHGELSHDDYNLIEAADNDLHDLLKDLKESGVLDNTLLILMADHGHRFAEIRKTVQGKLEERLPFFSFTFPRDFKNHFRQAYENFLDNLDKLATPFDVHKTLKSVISLDDVGEADLSQRAVSLFTKIPADRNCAHAYIEPHWCACLDWKPVVLADQIVGKLAAAFVETINKFTEKSRDLCERLSTTSIKWVVQMTPNDNLMRFNKNADLDGFVADMSGKTIVDTVLYQMQILLMPGDSLFEASMTYFTRTENIDVRMSDISRINKYGTQARCVENDLPHLRKYCYCRD